MTESKVTKTVFLLVFIAIIAWFLYKISDILLPFVLSGILAYILSPLITKLQSLGIKRTVAVLILYTGFLLIFVSTILVLLPRVIDEISVLKKDLPKYVDNVQVIMLSVQQKAEYKYPVIKKKALIETGIKKAQQFLEKELSEIPSYIMRIFSLFSLFILIPFVTFFLLLSGRGTIDRLFDIIPSSHVETALGIISETDEILGKYIRGQIIESAIVGLLTIIGLLALKVDYAILIGIVAGLLNMVPYIGPILGAVPAVLIGLLRYQTVYMFMAIVIVFLIVQFIDNNVLKPLIVSKGVNLSPVAMIFSIMAGAKIYGIVGMLVAIPVACIIKTIFQIFLGKHPS